MTEIMGIDLGTKTGIAWNYGHFPGVITKALATPTEITRWGQMRKDRTGDPRVIRLYEFFSGLPRYPRIVVFEDVQFQSFTKQTQLWSSLRTALWLAFYGKCLIECVPVTTLKKFATGSGAANKIAMRKALFSQFPETRPDLDDNSVDALWILKWAEKNLGRMKF